MLWIQQQWLGTHFIRLGHGADYDMIKLAAVFTLAAIGMCFLHTGFVHISDIGKTNKIKCVLRYTLELCSVGWLIIHFIVAANIFIFSQAEKFGGQELAVTLSNGFSRVGTVMFYIAYLFVFSSFIMLPAAIIFGKTCLKKLAVIFTPAVPIAIILAVSKLLPESPFSYGLFTFSMNGGMIIWFIYMLFANDKKELTYVHTSER